MDSRDLMHYRWPKCRWGKLARPTGRRKCKKRPQQKRSRGGWRG